MSLISTKQDLLRYLDRCACEYTVGAAKSVARNKYMNTLRGRKLSQVVIDAVVVDFVNWVGLDQGLDYGLYTKHLRERT